MDHSESNDVAALAGGDEWVPPLDTTCIAFWISAFRNDSRQVKAANLLCSGSCRSPHFSVKNGLSPCSDAQGVRHQTRVEPVGIPLEFESMIDPGKSLFPLFLIE